MTSIMVAWLVIVSATTPPAVSSVRSRAVAKGVVMSRNKAAYKAWVDLLDKEIPPGCSVDDMLDFLKRLSLALSMLLPPPPPSPFAMMRKRIVAMVIY